MSEDTKEAEVRERVTKILSDFEGDVILRGVAFFFVVFLLTSFNVIPWVSVLIVIGMWLANGYFSERKIKQTVDKLI